MNSNLIYKIISRFLSFVYLLIFARVIISWIIRDFDNKIVVFIYEVTDPIIEPFRMILDRLGLLRTFDFSPILAFFFIQFLQRMLYTAMFGRG